MRASTYEIQRGHEVSHNSDHRFPLKLCVLHLPWDLFLAFHICAVTVYLQSFSPHGTEEALPLNAQANVRMRSPRSRAERWEGYIREWPPQDSAFRGGPLLIPPRPGGAV